jgi:hypothetical protein
MISRGIDLLVAARNAEGAWGWAPAHPGNTECTALAAWALHAHCAPGTAGRDASDLGVRWLRERQLPDGSWPMSDQVPGSSWMSSLAVLALGRVRRDNPQAVRGAGWLLGQESRVQPWLLRAWLRLFPVERPVDQDPDLVGWPWTTDTAPWVEPTAWSLLAVKALLPALPARRAAERIRQAELMLVDRMCIGGGWNYGNKRVLGEALPPYPDTTALALMALHDRAGEPDLVASVARLEEMLLANRSVLVLALSALALGRHGRDPAPLRAELLQRLDSAAPADTRTLALALLAVAERTQFTGDPHA